MENISAISNDTDMYDELVPSRQIQFWTMLIIEIPSLICIIYVLYHLLFDKHLRQALHNHVIIILLFLSFIVEVVDNPLYLDAYLHNGRNSFHSCPTICLIWWFVDYGVYGAISVFLAWASFERHILIFYHNRLLGTKRKKIIFHYIPLGILSFYMTGFYIGVIVFPPCTNIFNYEFESCGMSPCYEKVPWLNIWDYWIHGIVCSLIEVVCSITLLIRVIWQRYRTHQRIQWKKHRKMTIQLLSISTLVLSINLPQYLIYAIQQVIPGMTDFGSEVASYFFYLSDFVVLLLPFVSLACLPELWLKLIPWNRQRQRTVAPFIMNTTIRRATLAQRQRTLE
jgi:hypothetical protein